jgi:arogenate/prephenate dehydratase
VTTNEVQTGSTSFKTSIVFSMAAGPGNLFKALSCFALRDIDLTKIESRPLRTDPLTASKDGDVNRLNYLFYADVLGAMADKNVQNALGHLQEFATFLRVFGSFPADVTFLKT